MTAPGASLEAALAAARRAPGPVEVSGSGALAESLRAELGAWPEGKPGTVVELTGDLAALERALERVADLGTVVLAGPPAVGDATIDLYAQVHLRGLTVVALPPGP